MDTTRHTLAEAAAILRDFIGPQQLGVMADATRGEEGAHFRELFHTFAERVQLMPATYQQDGLGMQAIAYLHYFTGSSDFYITERDVSGDEGDGQAQAFGYAVLNGDTENAELGYISLPEILSCGAELDVYFTPKPLADILRHQASQEGNP